MKKWLPSSRMILSTWHGELIQSDWDFDTVIFSDDPGTLPAFKYSSPSALNNVNRQILSSNAGLRSVHSKYALKLRTDCCLEHGEILRFFSEYGKNGRLSERIVVAHLFSVDPRFFEQMPFHFSDWLQFGDAAKLKSLWNTPLMSEADASYYDKNLHAAWSSAFDKLYRSRFAAEQYIWKNYAEKLGYIIPKFHNDLTPEILESHDRFLSNEIVIVDVQDIGLKFDRYAWALRSSLQRFNCINHLDWRRTATINGKFSKMPIAEMTIAQRRLRVKRCLKIIRHGSVSFLSILKSPLCKPLARQFLKILNSWTGLKNVN